LQIGKLDGWMVFGCVMMVEGGRCFKVGAEEWKREDGLRVEVEEQVGNCVVTGIDDWNEKRRWR
jgi:hypothetical protein